MIKLHLNTKLVMPNSAASEACSTPVRRSSCHIIIFFRGMNYYTLDSYHCSIPQ